MHVPAEDPVDPRLQHRDHVDLRRAARRGVFADGLHLVGLDVQEEEVRSGAVFLEGELAPEVVFDADGGKHQEHAHPERHEHHPHLTGAPEHRAHRVADREGAGRGERGEGAEQQPAQDPEKHRDQDEPAGDRERDGERPGLPAGEAEEQQDRPDGHRSFAPAGLG